MGAEQNDKGCQRHKHCVMESLYAVNSIRKKN